MVVVGVVLTLIGTLYLGLSSSLRVTNQLIAMMALTIGLGALWKALWPIYQANIVQKQERIHTWICRLIPYGIVAIGVFWAYWPAPFDLPINQDHGHHFLATKVFVDELLASGNLFGWTDTIAGGLPFGDVYATPAYFATSWLHLVTLTLVPLEFSYSFAIVVAWLLAGFVAVGLTREIVPHAVFSPALAGLAFVLDPGGDREGGWVYSGFHAVWPQFLATAVMALGVWFLIRFFRQPNGRRFALASLTFGSAIWLHPMVALNLAWLAPVTFGVALYHAWSGDGDVRRAIPWLVPLFGLAALIGLGFFIRMLSVDEEIASYSAHGDTLWLFGRNLLAGEPFQNQLVFLSIVALIGAVAAAARRDIAATLIVALTSLFVLLGSMELVLGTSAGSSDWLPLLMYRRFFVSAKPFWFVLIGVGFSTIWMGLRAVAAMSKSNAVSVFAVLMLTPISFALLTSLDALTPSPVGGVLGYNASGIGKDLDAMVDLLAKEQKELELERTVVVDWRERGDGAHYKLFVFAKSDSRYIATNRPPCQALDTIISQRSVAGMKWLGATHILSEHKKSFGDAKLVGSSGTFHLYRLVKEQPKPPLKLKGKGELEVVSWEPMRREIKLTEVDEKSVLIVGQPPFSKWSASIGGAELALDSTKHHGVKVVQIAGLKSGTLVLEYKDSFAENFLFTLAVLLCLLLVVVAWLGGPLPQKAAKLAVLNRPVPAGSDEVQKIILIAGTVATGLVFIIMVLGLPAAGTSALEAFWLTGEPEDAEVLQVLHEHEPESFKYRPNPYCVRAFSRNPRTGCTEESLFPRLDAGRVRDERIHACMRIGVPDKGEAKATFDLPEGTTHVKGHIETGRKGLKTTLVLGKKKHKLKTGGFRFEATDLAKAHLEVENKGSTSDVCLELVALRAKTQKPKSQ